MSEPHEAYPPIGSTGELFLDLLLVLLFIIMAGIFVAAEIALISLRESQLRQLEAAGAKPKRTQRLASLMKNPNRFLAAAQVGVTFCGFLSAALGSQRLGTSFVIPILQRWGVSRGVSTAISLVFLTLLIAYVSLVLGELVPKRLALYRTEKIALAAAPSIDRIANYFRPIIWLLSKSTDVIVRLFGVRPQEVRSEISEAELVDLVTGHAALSDEERDIVEEVFNTGDLVLHEIMVPRTEVDFLDVGLTLAEAKAIAVRTAHSRYPVTRGSSDEVIGFLHVRDLLNLRDEELGKTLFDIMRPVIFLPGTKGVLPALTELRVKRAHLAIVLDEYGGTDGIVTLEDIVECFIGDIEDEYDEPEQEVMAHSRTGDYEVDALISLEDLKEQTGIDLPHGPYETVGGFIMHSLGRLPVAHDVITIPGARITVLTLEGKRAGQLLISAAV
ncbi:MAG TPA: hemolysin family protein [Candidatus Nanopelagicaceae bacterium]